MPYVYLRHALRHFFFQLRVFLAAISFVAATPLMRCRAYDFAPMPISPSLPLLITPLMPSPPLMPRLLFYIDYAYLPMIID